jgi:5-methylcytosine-specific restriction endonuclease McrA
VTALALQMQRSKDAALEVAHAEMRGEKAGRAPRPREPIPEQVRHEVWRRDQGRCVDCGSRERLEFDHIVPWSEGGSNTARNIELRCETCNRIKGREI